MIYILFILLLAGCDTPQPWSYAPCYMNDFEDVNDHRVMEVVDCPMVSRHWRMVRVDEKHIALFTTPFGSHRVPRVYPWEEVQ